MCVYVLTICQQAGGTAGLTLAACPRWISSGDSPAQMCSAQDKKHPKCVPDKRLNLQHVHPRADTHQHVCVYLVEGGQVVSGLDEEGLVDPRMVHVMGRRCHQAQEHVQGSQLLRQLQHTKADDWCFH